MRPYSASANIHSPVGLVSRQWDAVDWACVLCDRRVHNDRVSRSTNLHQCACPLHSSRVGSFFLAKHRITQVCQHPYSPDSAPGDFWFFPKLKSPLKVRRFVNVTVTKYTSSVNGVSLPTYKPQRRVSVHGCTVMSPLTGCQFISRSHERFSRYSKWLDTLWTGLVSAPY
jgi:hypothetical protein